MARCTRCDGKLSWHKMFSALMIKKRHAFDCQHCGQELYFTPGSVKWIFGVTALIPISFALSMILKPTASSFVFHVIVVFLYVLIVPFCVRVTHKEEPLF
ncbi:TIGR04104 family putative zinc finger protein [Bacillus sp. KH172YL63]|uniref:TIGR04104 family putative zinc finger protein n=1 Tax=Bacillus sp. KH172YL63 TaxID=2709784 RepID=UPI00156447E4|nr:TIGR04104 family putative zinc finger protein [Bacillus sp. KH172YL63]